MDVELRTNLLAFFINVLVLMLLHLLSLRIVTDDHCTCMSIRRWLSVNVYFWMSFPFFGRRCCYFLIFLVFILLLKYLLALLVFYIFLLLILLPLCWNWLSVWKFLEMWSKLLIWLQNWSKSLWLWCDLFLYNCKIWIFKVLNKILSFESFVSLGSGLVFLNMRKQLIKRNRFTALTIHNSHHWGFFSTLWRGFSFEDRGFMFLMWKYLGF